MRWRKLKKYIQAHPYLIDKTYKLSMEEAQKRIDAAHMPTFEETIRAAMRKSSLPASAWEPALRVIDRRKKERARRKVLIPITASLAAVTVFFSATPIGQTLAADAARLVARIFDGSIVVESMGSSGEITIPRETEPEGALPPAPAENGEEQAEIAYSSFAELYEKTGLNPIIVSYEGYTLKSITLYPDEVDGKTLSVIYQNEALGELVTQQIWGNGEGSAIHMEEPYFEKPILNGSQSMYCRINKEDKLFEGAAILEGEKVIFQIGFAEEAPADAMINSLQYYR